MSTIHSMTGFASNQFQLPEGQLNILMRSVNSRFLEVNFSIDDALKPLESTLTKTFKSLVQRGKVDISITFTSTNLGNLVLNQRYLDQLRNTLSMLQSSIPQGQINLLDILQYPGVLQPQETEISPQLEEQVVECFKTSMQQFEQSRKSEGAHLSQVISQKLDAFTPLLQFLDEQMLDLVQNERERIINKLTKAIQLNTLDKNRLEQEITIQAQKGDIAEEYDRLCGHIKAMREILYSPVEANGKRLDFLSQEMLRECNTIASKVNTIELSNTAIELKVLSEQIREQVQNIE